MFNALLRTLIIYGLMVGMTRFIGRRQIGALEPFELAITILIADLASAPLSDARIPLFHALVPILTLVALDALIAIGTFKNPKLRSLINGKPIMLMQNGHINARELSNLCYNLNDLLEQLRSQGISNPDEVSAAVLETSGQLSVFTNSQNRPVTPADMHIPTSYESVSLTLILDGDIQKPNLKRASLDESWLLQQLKYLRIQKPTDVLLAYVTTQGMLFVQDKTPRGRLYFLPVLRPEQIRW